MSRPSVSDGQVYLQMNWSQYLPIDEARVASATLSLRDKRSNPRVLIGGDCVAALEMTVEADRPQFTDGG
jgi:hypothetical protein